MDGAGIASLSLSLFFLSLLPLEKGRIGRSVGLSDGVYKMRRLSFPNPLIWIFSGPPPPSARLLPPPPLVLGDIYLLKERKTGSRDQRCSKEFHRRHRREHCAPRHFRILSEAKD